MRLFARLSLALFALGAVAPTTAEAALRKYRLRTIDITASAESSPHVVTVGGDAAPEAPFDTAFVDATVPGAPVLRKFRFKTAFSFSTSPYGRCTHCKFFGTPGPFIFLRGRSLEGPAPVRTPAAFTGTGQAAAGSTIAWGVVTGWTITGTHFCRSIPNSLCGFTGEGRTHDTSVDPILYSDFYDLGTWTFHATGFTAVPFVHRYFSGEEEFGNHQRWIRGFRVLDATVPALPALGMLLLGASLVAGAVTGLRRRRP